MKRIIIGTILAFAYALFFRINPGGMIFLLGFTTIALLLFAGFLNREERRRKDFLQVTEYMQSLGMSFLLSGTEYTALKETITLFEKSRMKVLLEEALQSMEESHDGKAGERAFQIIEGRYPCKKLRLLHKYILTASKVGGEYRNGIRLLLKDLEMWKKQQLMAYEDLRSDIRKIVVATGLTILLCGYVTSLAGERIPIGDSGVYQIGMIVFWCGCVGIYILGYRLGGMDWFDEKEVYSPEEIQNKLLRHKKENAHHRIGYETRKKILCREMGKAFPEWMLNVALRMENKNVEVALAESYEDAPTIIKHYLKEMLEDLKTHPGKGEPYFQFAGDLHIPEITNSMKLLYGVSKGNVMDGKEQIRELIERNYQMENQAGDFRREKKRSVMYGCSLLPSLLGAGCMILNMSLLLIGFLGNLKI